MVFADGDCVDGVGIVEVVVWLHGQLAAVAATVVVALEAEEEALTDSECCQRQWKVETTAARFSDIAACITVRRSCNDDGGSVIDRVADRSGGSGGSGDSRCCVWTAAAARPRPLAAAATMVVPSSPVASLVSSVTALASVDVMAAVKMLSSQRSPCHRAESVRTMMLFQAPGQLSGLR